jgi:hypothetical protein
MNILEKSNFYGRIYNLCKLELENLSKKYKMKFLPQGLRKAYNQVNIYMLSFVLKIGKSSHYSILFN